MIILPINAILQGQSYTRPQVDAALALKQNVLTFDDAPTANSNNPVKSSGIKTELDGKLPIAENQEQAPVGYVLTKTSTGSQWQRVSSEGGTIAAAANSYPVTLLASDWEDHTYAIPKPQNATITADCDGILGLAPNASAAQVEAFQLAKIVVTSQSTAGVTVVARGQVPTINLSLELTLFMKADYYTKTEEDALLAVKAPLGSPALTGTPTAPTAASGTSTTQIATTAFVQGELSAREIILVNLGSQTGTGSSVTWSKSNAAITADHVVLAYELGTPAAQVSNLTWTTSTGAISVSGNINGTTTLTVILGIVGTSVT